MSQGPPPPAATLGDKYRELLRLRREAGDADLEGPPPALQPLAARFPGALRQLDCLPLDVISRRLAELEAAGAGEVPWPEWATWEEAYHDRLRATLRVKRAISRTMSDEQAMAVGARAWRRGSDMPGEPFTRAHLAAIRRPAGGRLTGAVLAEVAREVGATVDELRQVLFAKTSGGGGG